MYKQSPRLVKVSGDAHRRRLREGDTCRKDIYLLLDMYFMEIYQIKG